MFKFQARKSRGVRRTSVRRSGIEMRRNAEAGHSTPSSNFTWCPRCGQAALAADTPKSFRCGACGFGFFLNTAAAVAALITEGDRLLVTERRHDPAKGTWDLPGGFIDPGESVEAGLRREIREELNLEIVSADYCFSAPNHYEFEGVQYATVDLAFRCKVADIHRLRAGDDVAACRLVPFADIAVEKFGLGSIRRIVARFLEGGLMILTGAEG